MHDPRPSVQVVLWHWMPVSERFSIDMAFQVDHLSAIMLLVITGVGGLIHLFSVGYMRSDPGYARYFSYLNLFIVFMLVLVLGASLPVSFIGWEGVGLCSYLLIGFWYEIDANSDAGKKAFLANRIGDFGVLIAMFLIWWHLGTLDFTGIAMRAGAVFSVGSGTALLIALFLFLGCTGKSAQIPLYVWLPDAMAGPTPVSALIHAATMVTAGVFLVVRTASVFALAPISLEVVAVIGARDCILRGDHRPAPVRHQEGPGVLHRVAAGVHVPRRGHRRVRLGHLSPGHPRLLQGAALPRRRQRDPRDAPRASITRIPMPTRRTCATWAACAGRCRGRSR